MESIEALRPLPDTKEVEQALLSAILVNPAALERVAEFLRPEHFSVPFFGKVYQVCLSFSVQNRDINPITLRDYPTADSTVSEEERSTFLKSLLAGGVTIVNAADYGHQILDRHLRRQLIDLGYDVVNDAYTVTLDTDAVGQIENIEKKLYDLSAEGLAEGGPQAMSGMLNDALTMILAAKQNPNNIAGVATGLKDLDEKIGGLHKSDLVVLAGRPGMGKTALATCMAFNAAKDFEADMKQGKGGKSVLFFSLEMSREQLMTRILSTETSISGHAMRNGLLTQNNLTTLTTAINWMQNTPFYVDDTPGMTVGAIRTRARRLQRDKNKGLGLVVIDYLQLITPTAGGPDNRVQQISEITRQLKILAKELDVPVLALSQLSRKVEDRGEDKQPQLSDLRDSGSIEQDADIVLFVYREYEYIKKTVRHTNEPDAKFEERMEREERRRLATKNRSQVIIAKQRHGPTGVVDLFFDGEFTKFGNLQPGE